MDHETPAEGLSLNSEKVLRFSVARHDHHCLPWKFLLPRGDYPEATYDTDHKDCTVVLGRHDELRTTYMHSVWFETPQATLYWRFCRGCKSIRFIHIYWGIFDHECKLIPA